MNPNKVLTILGAGAMGAALTIPAHQAGSRVRLWFTEYDTPILEALRRGEPHPRLGVRLPEEVEFYGPGDMQGALEGTGAVILAVSSQGLPQVLRETREFLGEAHLPVGVITKGFEEWGGKLFTSGELVEHVMGESRAVYLAGPSLAGEVARQQPTPVALASPSRGAAWVLRAMLETNWYKAVHLSDLRGASLAASLKNPYAILYGMVEGLEEARDTPHRNLKAGLLTAVIREMAGVVEACGGDRETVYTLAGVGDVLVTVMGGRNSAFGRLLGSGLSVEEALEEMRRRGVGVVEGYVNTAEAFRYLGERCPGALEKVVLLRLVRSVLEGRISPEQAVQGIVELVVKEGGAAAGI